MNKQKLMSKIITAVVAVGVLLSSTSMVFAKDNVSTANGANSKSQHSKMNKQNSKGDLTSKLDALVTAGTITSAQETAITSAMETARQAGTKTDLKTVLDTLVTAGTITSDQETAIIAAMPQRNHK